MGERIRREMENRRGFRPWHTHGRTGAALFVPASPRLGGASNLLENQINLAAGCRTLSLSLSLRSSPLASIPLPSCSLLPHFSLSLSIYLLSVSRGHEQIEGTGPRWRRRRRWAVGPPCHRHGPRGEKRRWRSNKELWTSGCGRHRVVATLFRGEM